MSLGVSRLRGGAGGAGWPERPAAVEGPRKMAELREGERYGVSCEGGASRVTVMHVKLTETALRALEKYQSCKVSGAAPGGSPWCRCVQPRRVSLAASAPPSPVGASRSARGGAGAGTPRDPHSCPRGRVRGARWRLEVVARSLRRGDTSQTSSEPAG